MLTMESKLGLKFSGEWNFEIRDNNLIEEDDDNLYYSRIMTENDSDDIDFTENVKPIILEDEDFKQLKNGWHHSYFEGIFVYVMSFYEGIPEIDAIETGINYISFI